MSKGRDLSRRRRDKSRKMSPLPGNVGRAFGQEGVILREHAEIGN
jgi:hypothetical protein